MRTKHEIVSELKKAGKDPLLKLPTATIHENAPRALTQLALEVRIGTLQWVLNEKKKGGD